MSDDEVDRPLTKQDLNMLKDFTKGIFVQVEKIKEKPKEVELNKPALNHQYRLNTSVLEKITKAKEMLQDIEDKVNKTIMKLQLRLLKIIAGPTAWLLGSTGWSVPP